MDEPTPATPPEPYVPSPRDLRRDAMWSAMELYKSADIKERSPESALRDVFAMTRKIERFMKGAK